MTGPAVRGRGVVLAHGDRIALDESDFDIPAGRLTAVIGPNGSGKSTLLHAIAGLLDPIRGRLVVDPGDGAHRSIAYVLQATKVNETMPVTVGEVVMMGRYRRRGLFGLMTAADRADCTDVLERLGIADLRHRHLDELSGGQRQRVFVAQGLMQDAGLLLLDEPITGLDLVSRRLIEATIAAERARGTTVVVTTHDLDEAGRADHVLLLGGTVVGAGPPAEVLIPEGLSAAYGIRMVTLEDGRVVLDDAHHRPAYSRHRHFDRTGHADHETTPPE